VRQVEALRIGPRQRALPANSARSGMRGCGAPRRPSSRDPQHLLHRVGHQLGDRHAGVADAVDERGVGAVFQQAAHQVGQQRLVVAHRRVDAAGPRQLALGGRPTTCAYSGSPMPCRHWNSYWPL
jgi:hypothetical protein